VVLDEFHRGGVTDDRIVFVMANGAHHGRLLMDYQKKLGREIPEKYLVFNHFCYDHLVDLGKTSRGIPVHVNREVMSCDLKVAVELMVPDVGELAAQMLQEKGVRVWR
jgi:nickel-dependent lactate racemase